MFKKLFSYAIIAIAAISTLSCTQELSEKYISELAEVSINLCVETLPASRAISDGTGATQLMYAIFDEDGNVIYPKVVKNDITSLLTQKGHSMYITLPKGNVYQMAFWAQSPKCTAYTVSDDMKVTINYEGINNDELRDAFFAYTEPFEVNETASLSVILKRPFAQVNVGAYPYDVQYAKDAGIDVAKSQAHIENVPNIINLLDGTTEGEVTVDYTLSVKPSESLWVDIDEDKEPEEYEYLSMSYMLATPEGSTHNMSFYFTDSDEVKGVTFDKNLETVPVKRNWRTNIVGQILTGDAMINIKIDPVYEGDIVNTYGLYYNFTQDEVIKDRTFAFNTLESADFTSENNNTITFENVQFSGKVQYIAFGEYKRNDKDQVVVPFTNVLTNVVAKDMVVTHPYGITNVQPIDYMAPLIFLRGVSTLTNCEFTGTSYTQAEPFKDGYEDEHYSTLVYDCGVPNDSDAKFIDCTIDRMYTWSHAKTTLTNTTVKYLRASTHNQSKSDAHLTIDSGSVVDEIFVTSSGLSKSETDSEGKKHFVDLESNYWAPSIIIKAGAHVKVLNMNGRGRKDANGNTDVIIEEGATVDSIINEKID